MSTIINTLMDLGLTNKEASLYYALLRKGRSTVLELAKESGLKRPTVYLTLDSLRNKGLILKIPYAKKSVYIAKEPDEFFRDTYNKIKRAGDNLSQIKALSKKEDKVFVRYYEGEGEVKESLFYRIEELKGTEDVGFFAKAEEISPFLIKSSHQWREESKHRNIKVKGIAPFHPTLEEFRKTDKNLDQVFKSIPISLYSSNCSIDATDLFVRIVLFNENQSVIIENKEIVKTIKQIFNICWESIKN